MSDTDSLDELHAEIAGLADQMRTAGAQAAQRDAAQRQVLLGLVQLVGLQNEHIGRLNDEIDVLAERVGRLE
jgi:hypothetical protein